MQYLDTLQKLWRTGRAAKVFIPYEATAILGALGGIQELFCQNANSPSRTATAACRPRCRG
jgi:hypothetical protein